MFTVPTLTSLPRATAAGPAPRWRSLAWLERVLLAPAGDVTGGRRRRDATGIAGVLLAALAVGLGVAAGLPRRAISAAAMAAIPWFGVVLGALVVAYGMARSGHHRAAAWIGAVSLFGSAILALETAHVTLGLILALAAAVPALALCALRFAPTATLWIAVAWLATLGVLTGGDLGTAADVQALWMVHASVALMATLLSIVLDASKRDYVRLNGAVEDAETRYGLVAEGANDGLWTWQGDNDELVVSRRWFAMLGLRAPEEGTMTLAMWLERVHAEDRARFQAELDDHVAGRSPRIASTHRVMHANGGLRWVFVSGVAIDDGGTGARRVAGSMTDITDRKLFEQQLLHDALHDALTGLPNRALFLDRMTQAMARTQRDVKHLVAALYLDLDGFKVVNESLGHGLGDKLLLDVSRRIELCVRPGDTVARLGGDEFAVLLDGMSTRDDAERVALRIQDALARPFVVQDRSIATTVSVGIAHSNAHYVNAEELLRDADTAMFRAKSTGRGARQTFQRGMHELAVARLDLETDLRRAVDEDQLVLFYQPVVDLQQGCIVGFEALVRWRHPERGLVSPGEFIPVAEETGLIHQIGWWVLREACAQARIWSQGVARDRALQMNVNLSGRQFSRPDLRKGVLEILSQTSFDADQLRLEITETAMMESAPASQDVLAELRSDGICLCIDDFGTGYSSLSYLHSFDIDVLKIDRSFVSRLGAEPSQPEIIRTILELSRNLGLKVTAEGVETLDQLDQLRTMGCDLAQGYYFSPPVDARAAERLLTANPTW